LDELEPLVLPMLMERRIEAVSDQGSGEVVLQVGVPLEGLGVQTSSVPTSRGIRAGLSDARSGSRRAEKARHRRGAATSVSS
jgi:hypothetical protein